MPKIKFQAPQEVIEALPNPRPAKKFIPNWYKKMSLENKCPIKHTTPTIKKCMPVRDYLTTGYIIPSWADIKINLDRNKKYVDASEIPEDFKGLYNIGCDWHSIDQVKNSPIENLLDGQKCVKLLCPWTVTTPKGYSTFFTTPFYTESEVTILPAIVDTDKHIVPTNFPAIIHGKECLIKKGEPLIQAFPFKRENWDSEVCQLNTKRNNTEILKLSTVLDSVYTTDYWQKKRYR